MGDVIAPAISVPARRWDRGDWLSTAGMAAVVLSLHVAGWGLLVLVVAPHNYNLGIAGSFGIGLGVTAYLLGVRHAFDADHIAAIDNTTRKLVGEDIRARSVGFWFSLGHSTIVFGLCVLVALGMRGLTSQVGNDASQLQQVAGLIGTLVSGTFLILIGLLNLGALIGITRIFRRMRTGELDEDELERRLDERGFLARILGRVMRAVRKPWHMYPVGLLFGLGFDTATEVSLLVLAGGAAAFTLPWYAILTLPVLFAAGMGLFDAADGVFMSAAYRWGFLRPIRKVFYNLTVTALSVGVALVIGLIELLGLLATKLDITSGPLAWIAGIGLDSVGYIVVAVFVVTWLIALAVWRLARIEQRWAAPTNTGLESP